MPPAEGKLRFTGESENEHDAGAPAWFTVSALSFTLTVVVRAACCVLALTVTVRVPSP